MGIRLRRRSDREETRNGITGSNGGPPAIECGTSVSGGPPSVAVARARIPLRPGGIIGSGGSAQATIFAGQNGGAGETSCLPRGPQSIDCGEDKVAIAMVAFSKHYSLGRRQQDVLTLLIGRVVRVEEIAQKLAISPNTVRVHLKHINEKTGARSKAEILSLFIMFLSRNCRTVVLA